MSVSNMYPSNKNPKSGCGGYWTKSTSHILIPTVVLRVVHHSRWKVSPVRLFSPRQIETCHSPNIYQARKGVPPPGSKIRAQPPCRT